MTNTKQNSTFARLAQSVERATFNRTVTGSNPVSGFFFVLIN
jgi:hypothetical protein